MKTKGCVSRCWEWGGVMAGACGSGVSSVEGEGSAGAGQVSAPGGNAGFATYKL